MLTACGTPPIVYNKNITPKNSSYDELVIMLDKAVYEGAKVSSFWCTSNILGEKDLFSVSKYQILGKKPTEPMDTNYSADSGGYTNNYSVRVWSSTKGGTAVVINWKFYLLYGDRYYSKNKNTPEWCILTFTNENESDTDRLNQSMNDLLKSLGTLKKK